MPQYFISSKVKICYIFAMRKSKLSLFVVLLLVLAFFSIVFARGTIFLQQKQAIPELTSLESQNLESILDMKYEIQRDYIHPLPYPTIPKQMELASLSAILINAETGDILFEKDASRVIPPASMVKLFLMFTIFKQVEQGRISLSDIVPLPDECLACNMPPESSLMFLGKNQIVTVEELLLGLSISSGNDAAYALALYTFGSMENFLAEVNKEIKELKLYNTHIEEPSGYSEKNTTTAREMAIFCRIYINSFPESLTYFHSIKKNVYPKQKNIAPEDRGKQAQNFANGIPYHIWTPIESENTNKLLWTLEGCDGIKTGHIRESGYNLALTTQRNGIRYISITMLGPGKNLREGNYNRITDGTKLHEWAFASFNQTTSFTGKITIPALGTKEMFVNLVPAFSTKFAFPATCKDLSIQIEVPKVISSEIVAGKEYGNIVYYYGQTLCKIPLVADRNLTTSKFFAFTDFFIDLVL